MKPLMIRGYLVLALAAMSLIPNVPPSLGAVVDAPDGNGWKVYTNARFGFSLRYPDDWRLGNPLPDGIGVTLYPPFEHSLVALSAHMNVVSGSSQDGRQTLKEFADAHRRIISDLYGRKSVAIKWRPDQDTKLAGFPAKQVTFTYSDSKQGNVVEHHIMSLGRNEGRGIRVKVPLPDEERLMSTVKKMLETYQPGRDQNAISPLAPRP
ncbi:MAG: hypothetical protein A4E19_04580 [Nitrospira sp. SG-bin1]|nr:MAG: hypothetical protein A4E19_04580 [Nitrospira sp. SG-bin1]